MTFTGEFEEEGEGNGQGRRTDLHLVATAISAGATGDQIARRFPQEAIKYHRGVEAYREAVREQPPARRRKRICVLIGDSGTGKTRYAHGIAWTYFRQRVFQVCMPTFTLDYELSYDL